MDKIKIQDVWLEVDDSKYHVAHYEKNGAESSSTGINVKESKQAIVLSKNEFGAIVDNLWKAAMDFAHDTNTNNQFASYTRPDFNEYFNSLFE